MPHPIFDIDELVRLVVDELVETCPRTAVSFSLTCRSFEEPTLSSLWKEEQYSLTDLVRVLPNHVWVEDENGFENIVSGYSFPADRTGLDSPRRSKTILQRRTGPGCDDTPPGCADYTSILATEFPMVPFFDFGAIPLGGVLCPKLESLTWDVRETSNCLSFLRLFLSPRLKRVDLFSYAITEALPADFIQIISSLPTSLERLAIRCGEEEDGTLKDAVSAFICQCGSSLTKLSIYVSLTEAAIHHITQLPNLRSWVTVQGPPQTVPPSVFPPLEELRLHEPAALPWLHLIASHGSTILDPTFLSPTSGFRGLVALYVDTYCQKETGCTFRLTDADMENLVTALPRLRCLWLGQPCGFNTCKNTVFSLLSISTHCLDLSHAGLVTHFNTLTIVRDLQRLLNGAPGRDSAKCQVELFSAVYSPLKVGEGDIETVARGFKAIFPCLTRITGCNDGWDRLGRYL